MNESVQVGQEWAVTHGGVHDLFRVTEVLEGQYLRPPDVAIMPTEFCRIEYLTGRLAKQVFELRAPGHRLGGDYRLYRRADGTLTQFGAIEEKRRELREELHQHGVRNRAILREMDALKRQEA